MKEFQCKIIGSHGLSTRSAERVTRVADRFSSKIMIENQGIEMNARSLMGVIALRAVPGDVLRVTITGPDEEAAQAAMRQVLWEATEKALLGFRRLEQNLTDVVKESQIKLGYAYTPLQLFYPLASLNHTLGTDLEEEEMLLCLSSFAAYAKDRLGELPFSRKKDRFSLQISAEGMKYIHEHVETSPFLEELVLTTARHGCTLQEAEAVFHKHSSHVVSQMMNNGEFDLLLYFQDGSPDDYLYCLHQEGEQVIYHRYKKEDYEDFGF